MTSSMVRKASRYSFFDGDLLPCETDEVASSTVNRYNEFVARVEELGLPSCIDDKPLLNVRALTRTSGGLLTACIGERNKVAPRCEDSRPVDRRDAGKGLRMGPRSP